MAAAVGDSELERMVAHLERMKLITASPPGSVNGGSVSGGSEPTVVAAKSSLAFCTNKLCAHPVVTMHRRHFPDGVKFMAGSNPAKDDKNYVFCAGMVTGGCKNVACTWLHIVSDADPKELVNAARRAAKAEVKAALALAIGK